MGDKEDRKGYLDLRVSVSAFFQTLVKRRKPILIAAIFAAATASIAKISREPVFIATADITLSARNHSEAGMLSGANGGRGSLLFPGDLQERYFSSYLIPSILESRYLVEKTISHLYHYTKNGKEIVTDLYDYMNVHNKDAAVMRFRNTIMASYLDPMSGVTRLIVSTNDAELSYQILKVYIEGVERCLQKLRFDSIKDNLAHISSKLDKHNESLNKYETELKELREKNRDYRIITDPEFYLKQLKLEREIRMHEEMVKSLKSYYELTMSKLSDKSNRLTILAEPAVPTHFTQPNMRQIMMYALVLALLTAAIACTVFVLLDYYSPTITNLASEVHEAISRDLEWMMKQPGIHAVGSFIGRRFRFAGGFFNLFR
jgi:uncharacterized protein involved in exopolysaccharide biosynthesis